MWKPEKSTLHHSRRMNTPSFDSLFWKHPPIKILGVPRTWFFLFTHKTPTLNACRRALLVGARGGRRPIPTFPRPPRAPTSNRYDFRFNPSVKAPASTSGTTSSSPTRGLQRRKVGVKIATVARRCARGPREGEDGGCMNYHKST